MTKADENTVPVNIKKFNMDWIDADSVVIALGKRKTGKSTVVLDYLRHHDDVPIITVISPTDELNGTYKPHIPAMFIHDKFTPELVQNFLTRQKNISAKVKTDPLYANVDPRAILLLDDCVYNAKTWTNDEGILWIFMNGRHAKAGLIVTAQYVMSIPPNLRTNVDFVFICKEPKMSNKRKLYEHYAGMFPTFDMFNAVLTACTGDYGCLVIDNSSTSDKLEDQVFWYKAELPGNFRLCDNVFWQNNDVYNRSSADALSDAVDSANMNDFQKYTMQKNKLNYNVNKVCFDE